MGYLLEPIGARDRRGQRAYRSPRGLIQRQLLNAELFNFRRQLLQPLLLGRPVVWVGSVPGSLAQGDQHGPFDRRVRRVLDLDPFPTTS